jgi:hypothetical protein
VFKLGAALLRWRPAMFQWSLVLEYLAPSAEHCAARWAIYRCICEPYVEIDHRYPFLGKRIGFVRLMCGDLYPRLGPAATASFVRQCSARARRLAKVAGATHYRGGII